MKRILCILTIAALAFQITAQQEKTKRLPDRFFQETDTILDPFLFKKKAVTKGVASELDSVYEFDWSTANVEWIRTYGIFHEYNDDNNRIKTILKAWNSSPGVWENYALLEYTYDDNENRIKEVTKAWSGAQAEWINYKQRLFFFNEFRNLTSYTEQLWNSVQQSWDNNIQYLYGYDVSQHWIYFERQDWDPDSLRWEANYRYLYTYENNLNTETLRQTWNSADLTWVNGRKFLYYYDILVNLVEEIQFVWQSGSSTWEESTRISYILDQSGQVSEKIYQAWVTGTWMNMVRYTYQYHTSGLVSEIVYYIRDGEEWDQEERYLKEYDELDFLVREVDQKWQEVNGSWINDYKWEYYFTHYMEPLHAFISDSTNVSCYGFSDGTATVTITGGTPPYTILWNDQQSTNTATVYGLAADRYYTVTVTDAALNSVSDSVMLLQPPEIITGPIYGEVNVNQNDTVLYWVESDTSSYFSWFVTHGEILSAQGGDTIVVRWTQPGQGKVSVYETSTDGCEGDTIHLCVSISPTSVAKQLSGYLQIYPNPANQWITIHLAKDVFEPWSLEILDMTGKMIWLFPTITQDKLHLSLDNLPPGIYFFRIKNSSWIEIRKVVVE